MCIKITDSFLQKKKKQLIYLGSAASELDNSWSVLGKLLNSWATSAYWLPQWTLVMALKGSDNSSNFTPLQACWGKQHWSVIIFSSFSVVSYSGIMFFFSWVKISLDHVFSSQNALSLLLLMRQCYAAGVYYLDNSSSPFEWITMSVLLNCLNSRQSSWIKECVLSHYVGVGSEYMAHHT